MIKTPLASPNEITPKWLTDQMSGMGHLPQGAVHTVTLGDTYAATSAFITPLTIAYTADVPPETPEHLIFKRSRPGWFWGARSEVIFYTEVAAAMNKPPVPQCFYTAVDQQQTICALLLEDLSTTHRQLPLPLPPDRLTQHDLEQVVDEVVKLHAHWWQHPYLAERLVQQQGGPLVMAHAATPAVIRSYSEQMIHEYPAIIGALGGALSQAARTLYPRILQRWPDLMIARVENERGLTMLHGDFHLWNIYFPRTSTQRPCLLDWETYRRGFGPYDLAYLLTTGGDPNFRRRWEGPLLKRYHEGLLMARIKDYEWEVCVADYRLAIIANLFPPLNWQQPAAIDAAIAAYHDWNCDNL